ncbi:hypothetical protein ACP275_14G016600 [Erythranthe tilingii]
MVSQEALQSTCGAAAAVEPTISGPRISFSTEFLDENDFISICPNRHPPEKKPENRTAARNGPEFEFLSGNSAASNMTTADELFSEGKMLPFWQTHHQYSSETTLNKLKTDTTHNSATAQAGGGAAADKSSTDQDRRISWFLDDDPSPRPPKCTVLWKELLRLRKQRPSTLSPSSSSSSSSSSRSAIADNISTADNELRKINNKNNNSREKVINVSSSSRSSSVKKGVERTRSTGGSNSIRIRPVVNVPICTQVKSSSLPPLFPIRSRTKLLS